MQSVWGVVTAVQEGRFRLVAEDGRVLACVLSRKAAAEPQDLMALTGARVRVAYSASPGLIAFLAHRIDIEEKAP
jgi:hypothetical protein